MRENLTDRARAVIDQAHWARDGGSALLVALVSEGTSAAAKALVEVGVTAGRLRADVDRRAETENPEDGGAPVAEQTVDDVLRAADEQATVLGHEYIGPEHLLLALLNDPEGRVDETLHSLRTSPAAVRSALLRQLRGSA